MSDPILLARRGDIECLLLPALANRHGLVTGATGTGKTVSLQTLAENFSRRGVPVFLADVKGDLTGISQRGSIGGKLAAVLKERAYRAGPVPPPFRLRKNSSKSFPSPSTREICRNAKNGTKATSMRWSRARISYP